MTSDAISIAMAKDPAQRYVTYGQFVMALEAARTQLLLGNLKHQQDDERKEGGRSSWWRR
jgi:hypothetical protein